MALVELDPLDAAGVLLDELSVDEVLDELVLDDSVFALSDFASADSDVAFEGVLLL